MNNLQLRRKNDIAGLSALHNYSWLRAQELGWLLWPNTAENGRTQACRAAKSWVERKLMVSRELPAHSGKAYMIAPKGVELLAAEGIKAIAGNMTGVMVDGEWVPSAMWKHDLLTAGVLVRRAFQSNIVVITEAEIRRKGEKLSKIPDAILIELLSDDGKAKVYWVEVENAKKNGIKKLPKLGKALALAANGEGEMVCGLHPNAALVIFDIDSEVNNQKSVKSAIEKAATKDIKIHWARCRTTRSGVAEVDYSDEILNKDDAAKILMVLEAGGVTQLEKVQLWQANYSQNHVEVRPQELKRGQKQSYSAHVNDETPIVNLSYKAAKRAIAERIEELLREENSEALRIKEEWIAAVGWC